MRHCVGVFLATPLAGRTPSRECARRVSAQILGARLHLMVPHVPSCAHLDRKVPHGPLHARPRLKGVVPLAGRRKQVVRVARALEDRLL